jgi:hypothetical protein
MLINAPDGKRRSISDIEIPIHSGYSVYEVFDAVSLNKINLPWKMHDGKWKVDGKNLPSCEKYFVTLRGSVDQNALNEIVKVHAPEDPDKDEEEDRYWLHSALHNMAILENIYEELSIERVSLTVNIGIQKSFSTNVPNDVRNLLEASVEAEKAMSGRDRQKLFKEWVRYREAKQKVADIYDPRILIERFKKLIEPEMITVFLRIPEPFRLEGVTPKSLGLVPEHIGVNVHTDLSFVKPAADGKLIFKKKEFGKRVSQEFQVE